MELDNYIWHKNFSFPKSVNYIKATKEFEKEVSRKADSLDENMIMCYENVPRREFSWCIFQF